MNIQFPKPRNIKSFRCIKGKSVFISGPISGRQLNLAKEEFNAVEQTLRAHGAKSVFNPMILEVIYGESEDWSFYMKKCYDVILSGHIDAIIVLPDYSKSRGSCIEILLADSLNIPIFAMQD